MSNLRRQPVIIVCSESKRSLSAPSLVDDQAPPAGCCCPKPLRSHGQVLGRERLLSELFATDYMTLQMTPRLWESEEELKSFFMKVKEESGKVGLKLNIQQTKIMAFGPITSWEIDGETVETV